MNDLTRIADALEKIATYLAPLPAAPQMPVENKEQNKPSRNFIGKPPLTKDASTNSVVSEHNARTK